MKKLHFLLPIFIVSQAMIFWAALMPVTLNQAAVNAQQYLNSYYPGTTVGYITTFYGYYSVQVLQSGKTYDVLSVNGYTGQVWYHTWHGAFIQEL